MRLLALFVIPYQVTFQPSFMMESMEQNKDAQSKLVVIHGAEKPISYSFSPGCHFLTDGSQHAFVLLKCPDQRAGVAVTDEVVRVDLKDGKKESLVGKVVHFYDSKNFHRIIAVRHLHPLSAEKRSEKELFSLELTTEGRVGKITSITQGAWLPDDVDLELVGEEGGTQMVDLRKREQLVKVEKTRVLYRAKSSGVFKEFRFNP